MTAFAWSQALQGRGPVVPVLVIDDVADAVPVAQALVRGGLSALEITLRTPAALASIAAIRERVPAALVGVGTVRTGADLASAKAAGAQFAVSPGYTSGLGAAGREIGLPLLPGVATASEVLQASADGYRFLKFFPAVAAGGTAMLRSFCGPFPDVTFCPTGGITEATATSFLEVANVTVIGGTWLAPARLIAAGDMAAIEAHAARAAALRGDGSIAAG